MRFNFLAAIDGTSSYSVIPSPNEASAPASTPTIIKSRLYPLRDFRFNGPIFYHLDIRYLFWPEDWATTSLYIGKRLCCAHLKRLEGETGRQSNEPLYIVGVYCGPVKLGEGIVVGLIFSLR